MQLPSSFRMAYERAEIARIVADAGYAEVPRTRVETDELNERGEVVEAELKDGVRFASWAYQPLGALCHMRAYDRRNIYDYQLQETRQLDEPHYFSSFNYRRPCGQLILAKIEFDADVAIPHSSQLDTWHNKADWDEIMAVGDVLLRARIESLGVAPLNMSTEPVQEDNLIVTMSGASAVSSLQRVS